MASNEGAKLSEASEQRGQPPTLGVDTGGTFTDFVWRDERGQLRVRKELSSPANPAEAVRRGIEHLQVAVATNIIHGSTVATNALLERRGARTALIATEGFADVLAIGRQDRPQLYALVPRKPEPLVPADWRFEVRERVTAHGQILKPLDSDHLKEVIDRLLATPVQSVAVCLLFSFLRPEHERQVRLAIMERIGQRGSEQRPIQVTLSSDILPEYREFERTATTVINAYVAPLMSGYLESLERIVAPRRLAVMQSNGGIIGAQRAGREAVRTVLSGPAGGVVGATFVAGLSGFKELITFDMGGTSTDVALCPGEMATTSEGQIAGLPLRLPTIDIHTVGAGGGSIAYLDPGGALRVGPQSAGADPGPACYGNLTRQPLAMASRTTVTDANLVLGRLDPEHFLGGRMRLEPAAAHIVMAELGRSLEGASAEQAAWGVIRVANANMERAIRRISVERGHDPRDFTLVAFGGAGPLHACELATEMQIPRVLVPPAPGVLSALGMLVARPARDYSMTVMQQLNPGLDEAPEWLVDLGGLMRARAEEEMESEGLTADRLLFETRLDLRYGGQSHELTVSVGFEDSERRIADRFHRAHAGRYGFERHERPVKVVNLRLGVTAQISPPSLPTLEHGSTDADEALIGSKLTWSGDGMKESRLYRREKLRAGNRLIGPAIVFQYDTTTVVPPNWTAEVGEFGALKLTHNL